MRFVTKRGDLYKKYKAGWSLLFHHSVRPHPDWLPVMWYKDMELFSQYQINSNNKLDYQTLFQYIYITYGRERINPQ